MTNPSKIIRFDKSTGKLEKPTLLLRSRTGMVIGKLKYTNLNLSFVGKGMDEISFEVHRFVDGEECEFWERIIDLCIIDYVGYGLFEADVNITDEEEIIKTLTCSSLENELAQQILRNFHVNDTDAITVIDTNEPFTNTVFCNFNDTSHSLLHRVLADKAPHWKVGYVSEYFNINGNVCRADQVFRVFTVDGTSIYDFLEGDVSKEFSCVFVYDTYNRTINCYNLDECVYSVKTMKAVDNYVYINGDIYDNTGNYHDAVICTSNGDAITTYDNENIVALVCKHDRDYIKYTPVIVDDNNKIAQTSQYGYCPGIGNDTNIIVSNKLLSKSFSKESDSGQIKNCFYVTGGDDVITNYVGAANGSGNNYIYLFDRFQYEDMGGNLASAINEYAIFAKEKNEKFTKDGGVFVYDQTCVYDIESDSCKDSDGKVIPSAQHIGEKVYVKDGYAYYSNGKCYDKDDNEYSQDDAIYVEPGLFIEKSNLLERISYLEHTKFPDVSYPDTTAEAEKNKIINYFSSNKVYIQYIWGSDSFDHVTNTVEALIKTVCDMRYDVKILRDSENAPICTAPSSNIGTWTGNVEVTRQSDDEDTKTFELSCTVQLITDQENIEYCKQKINITIAKMNIVDLSIEDLEDYVEVSPVGTENPKALEWFEKRGNIYVVSSDETVTQGKTYYELDFTKLENLMKQYNLESLKSFAESFDNCRQTLTTVYNNLGMEENEIVLTSESTKVVRHIYSKRYDIAKKILDYRQAQVRLLQSLSDILDKEIVEFREQLNIKTFLDNYNPNYYYQFRSYIREDEYNNPNYVSDGLSDSETLLKAKELLDVAQKELSTACCIQYKISGDLNNIFAIKELETLHDDFALFNYVRVKVDNKIHKLRLIEIGFNDQSPESLNVTFSEQISSVDGNIDGTRNILASSAAMATTYSSTVKQAQQGVVANKTFDNIRQEGLDSSKYLINNSPEQVMTFGYNGLLGRSMLDEGVYLDDQMILTANGLYFSQDAFQNVCTAIGKFKFNGECVYGINAEYIVGNLIIGENVSAVGENSLVSLTGNGIEIKKALGNDTYETVMMADINGNGEFKGTITAHDGNIGGWEIGETYLQNKTSDTDLIKLDAVNKSIISIGGNNKSVLTSGYLRLYRSGDSILTVRPTYWTGDSYTTANGKYGAELASDSISKFISFGNVDEPYVAVNPDGTENPSSLYWYEYDATTNTYTLSEDTIVDITKSYYKLSTYATNMILNYGLNPSGFIEGVIVFTDQKVVGNLRTNGRLYLDTSTSAGYHLDRMVDSQTQLPTGIKTNGNFGVDGSVSVQGDVTSGNGAHTLSSKLKAEDNIQKIKWENVTLDGGSSTVARPVLYIGSQRFILYGEFGT